MVQLPCREGGDLAGAEQLLGAEDGELLLQLLEWGWPRQRPQSSTSASLLIEKLALLVAAVGSAAFPRESQQP